MGIWGGNTAIYMTFLDRNRRASLDTIALHGRRKRKRGIVRDKSCFLLLLQILMLRYLFGCSHIVPLVNVCFLSESMTITVTGCELWGTGTVYSVRHMAPTNQRVTKKNKQQFSLIQLSTIPQNIKLLFPVRSTEYQRFTRLPLSLSHVYCQVPHCAP